MMRVLVTPWESSLNTKLKNVRFPCPSLSVYMNILYMLGVWSLKPMYKVLCFPCLGAKNTKLDHMIVIENMIFFDDKVKTQWWVKQVWFWLLLYRVRWKTRVKSVMRYLLTRSTDIDINLNHLNTSQQIHFLLCWRKLMSNSRGVCATNCSVFSVETKFVRILFFNIIIN